MKTNKLFPTATAAWLILTSFASVDAALWTNTVGDGDINNAANWGGTFPSAAAGKGAGVNATPLVIEQAFENGTDNIAGYFVTGGTGGLP